MQTRRIPTLGEKRLVYMRVIPFVIHDELRVIKITWHIYLGAISFSRLMNFIKGIYIEN